MRPLPAQLPQNLLFFGPGCVYPASDSPSNIGKTTHFRRADTNWHGACLAADMTRSGAVYLYIKREDRIVELST